MSTGSPARDSVVIVTAVGAGMRETPGVASQVFGALAEQKINVIAIAQGSSECSISVVIARRRRRRGRAGDPRADDLNCVRSLGSA